MKKISYPELLEMLRDPDLADQEIKKYFFVEPGIGGFEFQLRVNPETVDMTSAESEHESAMAIGNGFERMRRRYRFYRHIERFPDRPIIVSEGDSWFQFPLLIRETIDHLSDDYNVWSLGAAGDTIENMIYGKPGKRAFEFMIGLRKHKANVKAFLFSGAGNDIIGEDPKTKLPMLESLLRPFNGDTADIDGHIDEAELEQRIGRIEDGYRRLIGHVRAEPGLESLPIVVHGYDYAFPYPYGDDDRRSPPYAQKDQWLGRAFAAKGIHNPELRRAVIKRLIDRLYEMLHELEADPAETGVWVVDCRGALPDLTDWNDEIHGTTDSYMEVSRRFAARLNLVTSASTT